jgi:hypothetical protein
LLVIERFPGLESGSDDATPTGAAGEETSSFRSGDGVIFVAKVSEVDIYYIMIIMDVL